MPAQRFDLPRAIYFRDELRSARAASLRDAEGFTEVCVVLEQLARSCGSSGLTLGQHRETLGRLASVSPLVRTTVHQKNGASDFESMFDPLLEGRNSAAHEGAYARNVTRHAVDLAITLEDALQTDMKAIDQFMVPDPVCARAWEPLAHLRQRMLRNAFSFLPVWLDSTSEWMMVSDAEVARYLRTASSKAERQRRLNEALEDVALVAAGESPDVMQQRGVRLLKAARVDPAKPAAEVAAQMNGTPVLVVRPEDPRDLLGIVTAFDLL